MNLPVLRIVLVFIASTGNSKGFFMVYDGIQYAAVYNSSGNFDSERGPDICLAFEDIVCPTRDSEKCFAVTRGANSTELERIGTSNKRCASASLLQTKDSFKTFQVLPDGQLQNSPLQTSGRRIDCELNATSCAVLEPPCFVYRFQFDRDSKESVNLSETTTANETVKLNDIAVIYDGRILLVGEDGALVHVENWVVASNPVIRYERMLNMTDHLKQIICNGKLCVVISDTKIFYSQDSGLSWKRSANFTSTVGSDLFQCNEKEDFCWYTAPFWTSASCLNSTHCVVTAKTHTSKHNSGDNSHYIHRPGGMCWTTDSAQSWLCGAYIYSQDVALHEPTWVSVESVHCDGDAGACMAITRPPEQGVLFLTWESPVIVRVTASMFELGTHLAGHKWKYKVAGLTWKYSPEEVLYDIAGSKPVLDAKSSGAAHWVPSFPLFQMLFAISMFL